MVFAERLLMGLRWRKRRQVGASAAWVLVAALCGCARAPATPGVASATTEPRIDALLETMRARLTIMHDVAHGKWVRQQPIADPKREQSLLDELARYAQDQHPGLDLDLVRSFMAAQIEAGKLVQQADMDRWNQGEDPPSGEPADLTGVLRPLLDELSRRLVDQLADVAGDWDQAAFRDRVAERAGEVITGAGIDDRVRATAIAPLLEGPIEQSTD